MGHWDSETWEFHCGCEWGTWVFCCDMEWEGHQDWEFHYDWEWGGSSVFVLKLLLDVGGFDELLDAGFLHCGDEEWGQIIGCMLIDK